MTEQGEGAGRPDPLEQRLAALAPAQRDLVLRIMERNPDAAARVRRRPPALTEISASFEQERLWFMSELLAHGEIFHVPTALRVDGRLHVEALRRALSRLTARHEALRTVFVAGDDGPRQVVLESVDIPLVVHGRGTGPDPVGEARTRAARAISEAFDLSTGPLLRCELYELGEDEHLFVIVQHHIVSDYWSLGILLSELGSLYAAELGGPLELEPLDLQYPDFAHWQRETLDRKALEGQLDFWREALDGIPGALDLPTDRPRPAIRTSQGRFHRVEFAPPLVAAMRRLAQENSTTLHVAFLSLYFGFLTRLTRHEELVVGVPVAGRTRPELQNMLGYFLNWLAIRVDVSGRPSLRQLVRRTRDAFNAALAHQDVPFDMLVRELQPARVPGITPVFQTSFSLRDAAPKPPDLPGLDVSFADLDGGATHFDLMAELWCEDDRVVGYLPYDDELFDESTVASYARWMTALLSAGTAEPDRPLCDVPLITPAEHAELVGAPAADFRDIATTLHGRFRERAAREPDATAVCDERCTLSYAELARRADRLAHVLLGRGAGPGTTVGLMVERSVDLPTAVLAVLKCGAAYLSIDPDSPADRTAGQFADCAVTVVIASPGLAGRLPPGPEHVVPLDWDAPALLDGSDEVVEAVVAPQSPAYVIYTSGSTGSPKGVVVSHANVLRLFTAGDRVFGLGSDDVWTLFHSTAFDFSVWELWGALLYGGRLVVVPYWVTRAPDAFLELLEREGVTVLSQTPSAFLQTAEVALARKPRLALRYVVFGGEALNFGALADWFEAFGEQGPELVNMYGITETTVHVTFRRVVRADTAETGSLIGEPLADLSLYVLDAELRPVPPGIPGEIFVGGGGVAQRYQGDPALTALRMLPDPYSALPGARMYRTGDLALRRRDGELVYRGRADQQYKIRGHRVELGEVQTALLGLDEVARGAAFVAEDRVAGLALHACVVPATEPAPTPTQIRRRLLRILPDWMVPTVVLVLDELPLTRNGKLDQRALVALRREEARRSEPSTPPSGEVAEALAAVWEEMLGVSGIGGEANFFELGGHSLMVVQLVSRIHVAFGREIPMETLFLKPELQAMADAVEELAISEKTGLAVESEDWIDGLSEAELDAMLAAVAESPHEGDL
ncbi:amino acid adenylation domain-containing protein [Streptomyces sp. 840.1]|uniref:non-ribosomal peptide synthetase n=1 Tax=Streptomyces sp. 840.1 TaxID=2485152 RepID=UPI000F49B0CA|nr:non-ribosomal peptide synthetase [Streptomyces sp. 840.1]ROQ69500.1 amino acid adenylation domain-containing protein [Streptomyces sp. 840.1]